MNEEMEVSIEVTINCPNCDNSWIDYYDLSDINDIEKCTKDKMENYITDGKCSQCKDQKYTLFAVLSQSLDLAELQQVAQEIENSVIMEQRKVDCAKV